MISAQTFEVSFKMPFTKVSEAFWKSLTQIEIILLGTGSTFSSFLSSYFL